MDLEERCMLLQWGLETPTAKNSATKVQNHELKIQIISDKFLVYLEKD